jgi:diadenosine tetraphosphate (Ap4A) HIT family hydrolase
VVHADNTSLEGWLVLVLRRHVLAVADLTRDEAAALGPLITKVSNALRTLVECEQTYVALFAEHPQHRHVHVHVVPRAADLPEELQGPSVFRFLGGDRERWVSEARMSALATTLRPLLRSST